MSLQGTLDSLSLADVIRLMSTTRKSGLLALQGNRGIGNLWFDQGQVVGGVTDRIRTGDLVDVMFDLLRFSEGTFVVDADAQPEDKSHRADVETLLRAVGIKLDKYNEILTVVPSPLSKVRPRPQLTGEWVVVNADHWKALLSMGDPGLRTVEDLGTQLDLNEYDSSELVRDMYVAGLVDIDSEGVEPVGPVTLSDWSSQQTLANTWSDVDHGQRRDDERRDDGHGDDLRDDELHDQLADPAEPEQPAPTTHSRPGWDYVDVGSLNFWGDRVEGVPEPARHVAPAYEPGPQAPDDVHDLYSELTKLQNLSTGRSVDADLEALGLPTAGQGEPWVKPVRAQTSPGSPWPEEDPDGRGDSWAFTQRGLNPRQASSGLVQRPGEADVVDKSSNFGSVAESSDQAHNDPQGSSIPEDDKNGVLMRFLGAFED